MMRKRAWFPVPASFAALTALACGHGGQEDAAVQDGGEIDATTGDGSDATPPGTRRDAGRRSVP